MITLTVLLTVNLSQPKIEKPKQPVAIVQKVEAPEPIPEPVPPPVTWQDNPNNCDESTQWIAAESPFECINKYISTSTKSYTPRVDTPGNTYFWGQCVWHIKNIRPDVPNSWGNAYQWLARAQSDGWSTGSVPSVGAIAWAKGYSHVAIVRSIGDGYINLEEMNAVGLGVVSYRNAPITEFLYIY